jgi:hypothetical protein
MNLLTEQAAPLRLVANHGLMCSYQPVAIDFLKDEKNSSINHHSSVCSAISSGGIAEVARTEKS